MRIDFRFRPVSQPDASQNCLHRSGSVCHSARIALCVALGVLTVAGLPANLQAADRPVSRGANGAATGESGSLLFRSLNLAGRLKMKTLGGRQFWADVRFYRGWRIQQNVITDHYRLLDAKDFRHASGTLAECQARLDEIRREHQLPPMQGHAVILIHGVVRSSKCFSSFVPHLARAGYVVVPFDYPSTRVSIPEAAASLQQVIDSLEGIEHISLVVHSMGGLVVRTMLAKKRDPRLARLVMLGVPNNGASLARQLKGNPMYRMIYGPAGQQLVDGEDSFVAKLPVPDFPFAVIAGAKGTPQGYNPLVPGDDDGTVSLESARLPGAADFMTFSCLHSFLMRDRNVIAATLRFLQTGCLREDGQCLPIPAEPEDNMSSAGSPAPDVRDDTVAPPAPQPPGGIPAVQAPPGRQNRR